MKTKHLTPMHYRLLGAACALLLGGAAGAQSPATPSQFFTTAFITENQYIESAILKDVALMLAYSKTPGAAAAEVTCEQRTNGPCSYVVTLGGRTLSVSLAADLPMWEPSRYERSVSQFAAALKLENPAVGTQARDNILRELENPRLETLALLSTSLSARLQEHMLDSAAHQQAALLLAAFALRERLEPYDDLRWSLSRLTAHLAVSRWLSGGNLGLEGRYALTTAYALMNLQTNALGRLRALEQEPGGSPAWNRALYARVTGDPRVLAALPVSRLTLFEGAERVAALSKSVSREAGFKDSVKFVKAKGEKDFNSDLFFAIFRGNTPGSVGFGRALYLESGFKLILRDVAVASRAVRGSVFDLTDPEEFARRLNVEPGPCVHSEGQVSVLDWGGWAMQFQRRFAAYYSRSVQFMRDQWGLPAQDLEQEKQALSKVLGRLWLVRCLAPGYGTPAQASEAEDFYAARPQTVPIHIVRTFLQSWAGQTIRPASMSDPNMSRLREALGWCWDFPTGTYLGLEASLHNSAAGQSPTTVVQSAPFNMTAVSAYLEKFKPAPTETRAFLQPLAEFNAQAASRAAETFPPEQWQAKEAAYQKLAALSPDFYLRLYAMFEQSDPARAAAYFDKGRASGADAVGLANQATAVVLYYLSVNNRAKAREIAEEADTCGSARGFEAMQAYCLRVRDFQRGLKAARDQQERYEKDDGVVLGYIERVKQEDPAYHGLDQLYQQELAKGAAHPVEPYTPTTAAPRNGIQVLQNGRALHAGDIVVAVDNKVVRNARDARWLRRDYTRRTGDSVNIPLRVYRQGRYLDLKDTTEDLQVSDHLASAMAAAAVSSAPVRGNPQTAPPAQALPTAQPQAGASSSARFLRLNGISGLPPNRLAIINGKTLAAGESAVINSSGQNITVRCLDVRDSSVSVQIQGLPSSQELFLNGSGAAR